MENFLNTNLIEKIKITKENIYKYLDVIKYISKDFNLMIIKNCFKDFKAFFNDLEIEIIYKEREIGLELVILKYKNEKIIIQEITDNKCTEFNIISKKAFEIIFEISKMCQKLYYYELERGYGWLNRYNIKNNKIYL